MQFRPCIDLHDNQVKQIVGSSLRDTGSGPETNFVSEHGAGYFAGLYRDDQLEGAHVIMLGKGNDRAAREALAAWPGHLQLGGGINPQNAAEWLDAGAGQLIFTSWIFNNGRFERERLRELVRLIGRERIVLDLSCRKRDEAYWIVTDRWQKFTDVRLEPAVFSELETSCAEFLIHAVDVEGKQAGIDGDLLQILARERRVPCVYAGGIRSFEDIDRIEAVGAGRIDFTIGSALDLFGGPLAYREVVKRCARREA